VNQHSENEILISDGQGGFTSTLLERTDGSNGVTSGDWKKPMPKPEPNVTQDDVSSAFEDGFEGGWEDGWNAALRHIEGQAQSFNLEKARITQAEEQTQAERKVQEVQEKEAVEEWAAMQEQAAPPPTLTLEDAAAKQHEDRHAWVAANTDVASLGLMGSESVNATTTATGVTQNSPHIDIDGRAVGLGLHDQQVEEGGLELASPGGEPDSPSKLQLKGGDQNRTGKKLEL
jgi:hypothetical protein